MCLQCASSTTQNNLRKVKIKFISKKFFFFNIKSNSVKKLQNKIAFFLNSRVLNK